MPRSKSNDGFGSSNASITAALADFPPTKESTTVRAFHLTATEHAISSIALGRLKLSRFSDLNDPFELMAVDFRDARVRKAAGKHKQRRNESLGLLCFSETWKEPVMWSHYGARHKGICLGFDIAANKVEKVLYEDSRLRDYLEASPDPEKLPSDLQDLLLKTKYGHWKYERELRMFVPLTSATQEADNYFFNFSQGIKLVEVILGPLCTLSLDTVRGFVNERYPEAKVYKARLAHKTFRVVPDALTVPK